MSIAGTPPECRPVPRAQEKKDGQRPSFSIAGRLDIGSGSACFAEPARAAGIAQIE
jgi:hypothetical protein